MSSFFENFSGALLGIDVFPRKKLVHVVGWQLSALGREVGASGDDSERSDADSEASDANRGRTDR